MQITSAREALQHAAMHEQKGLPASASTILTIGALALYLPAACHFLHTTDLAVDNPFSVLIRARDLAAEMVERGAIGAGRWRCRRR